MSSCRDYPRCDIGQQGCRQQGCSATLGDAADVAAPSGAIYAVSAGPAPSTSQALGEWLYRVFEVLAAAAALALTLPLLLIIAAIVKLDSPGPVLFRHRRPARSTVVRGDKLVSRLDLRPPQGGFMPDTFYLVPSYFTLIKFRTMFHDARERFPDLYAHDYRAVDFRRQNHTFETDPRVTRAGRVLRRLSVDELPNLWSVLVGKMRLVGPRPEAPEVLQYYSYDEMYKFACLPGITGLAQVNGRGLLTWGETLDWDLRYVRNRSVSLDLKILLQTVRHLGSRHGAF